MLDIFAEELRNEGESSLPRYRVLVLLAKLLHHNVILFQKMPTEMYEVSLSHKKLQVHKNQQRMLSFSSNLVR